MFVGLLAGSVAVLAARDVPPAPRQEDLIGTWAPVKEAMQEIELRTPNRAEPEIELSSRGSFAVINIPGWWRNVFGQPAGKLSGVVGARWTLQQGKAGPELLLQDDTFSISMVLTVEGQKPPYFILLRVEGTPGNVPVRFYRKSGELNPPNQSPKPTLAGGKGG
jgi:hypothetical protein